MKKMKITIPVLPLWYPIDEIIILIIATLTCILVYNWHTHSTEIFYFNMIGQYSI